MNKRIIPASENKQITIEIEFVEYNESIYYHSDYVDSNGDLIPI
jgi:hypothetical protein